VLQLCIDLCQAAPHEIGPLVVTRLSSVLDVSFALLLTAHEPQPWFHAHPHSAIPRALPEAVAQRAQELFAVPAPAGALVEKVQRLPILFLPVWDGHEAPAVLCLGPKRSGDNYTPQDQALLATLARHLAVVFANKRLRAQLDEQMAALHRLAEERKVLAERVLSAAEEERRRLAGVLHDEAIQLGGDVVRRLNDLLAQPDLPLESHMELAAAASLGQDLVVRLREVVADLYPPPLQTVGLLPALQALLRDIEHRNPLTCPLSADPSLHGERLAPVRELALYNIAREAVCNAVHHARATTVHLKLWREGEHLWLTVCDDGVGFTVQPVGALLAAGHLGLALLEQRVGDLGGTLQIVTSPGSGTTIDVRVPIPMASAEDG
jgi:signal transduction histidine kinase